MSVKKENYPVEDYSDIIDLTQYDADVLDMCTADGRLLAVPVSRTGRVFLWNETTFEKAGLSVPGSFSELCEAGRIFAETLGADYTQKNADGHDHISPDGAVDASTCFFPVSFLPEHE